MRVRKLLRPTKSRSARLTVTSTIETQLHLETEAIIASTMKDLSREKVVFLIQLYLPFPIPNRKVNRKVQSNRLQSSPVINTSAIIFLPPVSRLFYFSRMLFLFQCVSIVPLCVIFLFLSMTGFILHKLALMKYKKLPK